MIIIEDQYEWAKPLYKRSKTTYCVIHHCGGGGMTMQQIHKMHINNGWAGIGYHFVITKDGMIHRGRPIDKIGTHTMNYNGNSIGICFEGNYENEHLGSAAYKSGVDLLDYITDLYPEITFKRHKDLNATACPGKYFPFEEMIEEANMTGEQIVEKINQYYGSLIMPTWAEEEIQKAKDLGLTDGSNLMQLMPRYQGIILALRAYEKGLEK